MTNPYKKQIAVLACAFLFLILACRKEKADVTLNEDTVLSYLPLSVGNYWVYTVYDIDTLGNEIFIGFDSSRVKRIEVNNGRNFAIIEEKSFRDQEWYELFSYSDSAGYMIDTSGTIHFSLHNFTDTLQTRHFTISPTDTIMEIHYKMQKPNGAIYTPSGEYEHTLNYQASVHTFIPEPGIHNPRYFNSYYAKGVGLILSNYGYWKYHHIIEKRLIRYHVVF